MSISSKHKDIGSHEETIKQKKETSLRDRLKQRQLVLGTLRGVEIHGNEHEIPIIQVMCQHETYTTQTTDGAIRKTVQK